jgi:hypothetical protein
MFSWNDKQAKRWGLPILPGLDQRGKDADSESK